MENLEDQMENPIIEKHMQALRATTEYQLLMQAVANSCRDNEKGLAVAADSIVRGVAKDVSMSSATGKLVILHLMVMPGV